ncbi:Transposon Ty3-I Gag-Pol polyprotein [Abeliophyllum distichum]|uniref:Transposon Ty3-I Gag-Pol polyprotein n=1 Tax=Abeliophyllum distichum TaxID=126358 RepID=A0ABD1TWK3_9LAMI
MKDKENNCKSEKRVPRKHLLLAPRSAKTHSLEILGIHILNTSLENVLMQTKGNDILKKPVPMRVNSFEMNQRKYCKYHRSVGHDTDDCRDLKGEIESLIRRGHLKEFLARPAREVELPPPRNQVRLPPPSPPQQGRGKIHMIAEGNQHLEGSRRQRRKLSREAQTCYQKKPVEELGHLDPRLDQHEQKVELIEELELIEVDLNYPEKVLRIGKELMELIKSQLMTFLKDNIDVFAWEHADMKRIDPKVACHRLNIILDVKPRQQHRCLFNLERYEALAKEVDKLLNCSFIRESLYLQWMANLVLVKKSNGTWRIEKHQSNLPMVSQRDVFQTHREDHRAQLTISEKIEELENIPIGRINYAAINQPEHMLTTVELNPSWMDEIIQFLKDGRVTPDSAEARKLRTITTRYTLIDEVLFKKGFSIQLLMCLREDKARYALNEVHEGVSCNCTGGQSLAHKILRQGYFWPSLKKDSIKFVQKCDKCQRFTPTIRAHLERPISILSSWPFSK